MYMGGKFLKKLWCCIGGSITRANRSDEGLTLETSASAESLYGGQFTLSTQLIKPNYLDMYMFWLVLLLWMEGLRHKNSGATTTTPPAMTTTTPKATLHRQKCKFNFCAGSLSKKSAVCKDGYCVCTGQDYDYYTCLRKLFLFLAIF